MSVLPLYSALLHAGVPEDEAKTAAESVVGTDQVATKADLAEVRADLADLRAELARMEMRMTVRLAGWVLAVASILAALLLAGMRLMLG